MNWSFLSDWFIFLHRNGSCIISADPIFYFWAVRQYYFNLASGSLLCKYFLNVFEKICCFCISHHSIVTAGVSQLVTMDGLHVSFSGCFYRVKSGFWSHFCLSVFLTVFHVDHKKSSSSYSSFSPLKMSLSSLSLSLFSGYPSLSQIKHKCIFS